MLPSQPILIRNAGFSGLALARGLLKACIPFRIFERDAALNTRSQGYRVRISGTGVEALSQFLPSDLLERVRAISANVSHFGARLNVLTGKESEGPVIGGPRGEAGELLSLDRTVLRSVLFRGLEGHVEFGKELSSYRTTPSGVILCFSDGSELNGFLLVGADGVNSRVRKQFLPKQVLLDTKARLHEKGLNLLTLVQEKVDEVPLMLLLEPIRFIESKIRAELPRDYVYWALISQGDGFMLTKKHPEIDDKAIISLSHEESAALCIEIPSNWHPSFHVTFAPQEPAQTSILRICTFPPGLPAWNTSDDQAILLEDAAHPMSPTAGAGGTTAQRYAATFMHALREEGALTNQGVSMEALAKYEAVMRVYAGDVIERGAVGVKMLF